jgi:hypothetical protein
VTTRDQEEQDLRIDQMTVNIEKMRREMRWEVPKAVAAILAATAAMAGIILAVAHVIH